MTPSVNDLQEGTIADGTKFVLHKKGSEVLNKSLPPEFQLGESDCLVYRADASYNQHALATEGKIILDHPSGFFGEEVDRNKDLFDHIEVVPSKGKER